MRLIANTAFCLFFIISSPAWSSTLVVTNLNDSGPGSFRGTVAAASNGDQIQFGVTGTIALTSGEILIDKNLMIVGPGMNQLTISGEGNSRVLYIAAGRVRLHGVTVSKGFVEGSGAGIYNAGELKLSGTRVSDNYANEHSGIGGGGGIYNEGTLWLRHCEVLHNVFTGHTGSNGGGGIYQNGNDASVTLLVTEVRNNKVFGEYASGGGIYNGYGRVSIRGSRVLSNEALNFGYGGGIFSEGGSLTVDSSTIFGNAVDWEGGGIYHSGGDFMLLNSTIAGNQVIEGSGGGLYLGSFFSGSVKEISVRHSTITENSVLSGFGGGITLSSPGLMSFEANILAGNAAPTSPDCDGNLPSGGYNLIGDISGCDYAAAVGDLLGDGNQPIEPMLNQLSMNGGPTPTQTPLTGSPVIDSIPLHDCALNLDQRRIDRPVGIGCDMGAVEFDELN